MNAINSIFEFGEAVQFLNNEKPGDDPKGDDPVVPIPPTK